MVRLTCLSELLRIDNDPRTSTPDLVIFHTSRCGSTLLNALLASHNEVLALSEPQVISALMVPWGPVGAAHPDAAQYVSPARTRAFRVAA
jgi:hypothetical protein